MAQLPPANYLTAVVKRGPQGCSVIDASEGTRRETHVDAFSIKVTSTIGSGDAFAGGVAAELAADRDVVKAAVTGNAAAAAFLSAGGDPLAEDLIESLVTLSRDHPLAKGNRDGDSHPRSC